VNRDQQILDTMANTDWWNQRIAPRLEPDGACLRWAGAHSASGYGNVGLPGTGANVYVHRVAYLRHAQQPIQGVIDHTCNVRDCANPEHLRDVSQRDNVLALHSHTTARLNADKTQCPRGHPLIGPNAQLRPDRIPNRVCAICNRSSAMRRRPTA
jgi:hypothetical protein